ncbi:type II secretion system protein [Lentibacillus jeotgali]|uniref:type II secretion system protein n=1 Tax=Lentibacillus jeotgali TaxID=558169 RepID=UPI000262607A|nr:type II secretion system protein [Lentibacillus jeotgali]
MTNSNGFSMIEALVAASLLMVIITTLIPLASLLLNERESLQQKQNISSELHHQLQPFLREEQPSLPHHLFKTVDGTKAEFQFTNEGKLLKGCARWKNANERKGQFCLYGYPEK